ncbi:MAG: TonB-dependent receptor [Bacteroidales bacterium]
MNISPTLWLATLLLFVKSICFAGIADTDTLNYHKQIRLNEVIISVNREISRKLQIPRQIVLLPSSFISHANTRSMSDLLAEQGSVAIQKSQQGGGSPIIRGFEASRVLLITDNIRMNNLIYRTGHLQNAITVDQNMLERVEILYGPASIAYGSDALGGTILFHTRNPKFHRTEKHLAGNAFVRYGSVNNEVTGHIDLNAGGRKFASLTSFTYSHFDDLKSGRSRNPFLPKEDSYIHLDQYTEQNNGTDQAIDNQKKYMQRYSGYEQFDLLQKFRYQPDMQTEHLLNIQLSNSSDINRYDRLTETKGDKPKFAEWYYGPQFRLLTAYEVNSRRILGADRTALVLAYQKIKESRHNRRFSDDIRNNRYESVNMVTLSTDWIKQINTHKLHTGIDGMISFAQSEARGENRATGAVTPISTRYADGGNQMHNLEAYLTHTWAFSAASTLQSGLRIGYSHLHARFDDKTFFSFLPGTVRQQNPTYSIATGLNHYPSDTWKLSANLASGFRVPNIDDLGKVFDSQAGRVIVPNPNIRPEQTFTSDLNATYHQDERFIWENNLYATYYFNAITVAPASFSGSDSIVYDGIMSKAYTSINARRAFIIGYSTTLKAQINSNLTIDASIHYTYGRILESPVNKPLDHIPPLFGRIGIGYEAFSEKLFVEFYTLFNGKKALKNYNTEGEDNINYATVAGEAGKGTPAWFTLNLKASWHIYKRLTLQAGVENLLDTEYRLFASGINAPGRNIYLTLRSSF